jgi:para-nitrobenzyl esterase
MKRSLIPQRATRVGTICALAMLGSLGAAPSRAASLVIQTEGGTVEGNVALGVENFLDIPYAAAPVGELRWSPPQPPAHWSDVRPAKEYGSYCPQPKTLDSANRVVNEDCLDVNVQRPIGTPADAKLLSTSISTAAAMSPAAATRTARTGSFGRTQWSV